MCSLQPGASTSHETRKTSLSTVRFQTDSRVASGQKSHSNAAISTHDCSSLFSLFNTTIPKKGNNMKVLQMSFFNDGKSIESKKVTRPTLYSQLRIVQHDWSFLPSVIYTPLDTPCRKVQHFQFGEIYPSLSISFLTSDLHMGCVIEGHYTKESSLQRGKIYSSRP